MKHSEPDTLQTQEAPESSLSDIAHGEVIIGTLVEIDEGGQPLVDFPENSSAQSLKAMTMLVLTQAHIGRQIALLFASGNLQKPVIMGMIRSPLHEMLENSGQSQTEDEVAVEIGQASDLNTNDVLVDGNEIVFEAKEQIVLRCGESSIVLTRDGKISIRGKNVLTRSTGVNRILGGSIQLN